MKQSFSSGWYSYTLHPHVQYTSAFDMQQTSQEITTYGVCNIRFVSGYHGYSSYVEAAKAMVVEGREGSNVARNTLVLL